MSEDRYTPWIRDKIAEHQPSADHNAVVRLAEACVSLTSGAGMVFGMMMPAVLPARDALRDEALETLRRWVARLDPHATRQIAEIAARGKLPIDLSSRLAEHEANRRAALDARIGKSLAVDARYADLERAVLDDPEDREAYLVLADYLQGQADPRGELIALQLAGETDAAKSKAAQTYLDAHHEALIGALVPHQKVHDGTNDDAFTWRRGYLDRAKLSGSSDDDSDEGTSEILEILLRHPSGRFLRELVIGFDGMPGDGDLQPTIDVLAEQHAPALRRLHLGDFEYPDQCEMSWFNVGELGELWRAVPRLTHLIVQGNFTLGAIEHARLERLELRTGGLPAAVAREVSAAVLPALVHLDVWYGSETYGGDSRFADVEPLLARRDLPALRHLGLRNCEYTDEICRALPHAPVLAQLRSLDLSMGTMSDDGVAALVAHRDALRHLETIDVSQSWITSEGLAQLRTIGARVIDEGQQASDGPDDRYVAVGE